MGYFLSFYSELSTPTRLHLSYLYNAKVSAEVWCWHQINLRCLLGDWWWPGIKLQLIAVPSWLLDQSGDCLTYSSAHLRQDFNSDTLETKQRVAYVIRKSAGLMERSWPHLKVPELRLEVTWPGHHLYPFQLLDTERPEGYAALRKDGHTSTSQNLWVIKQK